MNSSRGSAGACRHRLVPLDPLDRELLHIQGERDYLWRCRKCGSYLKNRKKGDPTAMGARVYYLQHQKTGKVRPGSGQKMPPEIVAQVNADMAHSGSPYRWVSEHELEKETK